MELVKVCGLRGFTWADSLDEQRLFLERICAFRHQQQIPEEGRGIIDTQFALREPSVIPSATFGWWWHVDLLGKRQVTEL